MKKALVRWLVGKGYYRLAHFVSKKYLFYYLYGGKEMKFDNVDCGCVKRWEMMKKWKLTDIMANTLFFLMGMLFIFSYAYAIVKLMIHIFGGE